MAKKIRLHNVVEGAGSLLVAAFRKASGHHRLEKRDIVNYETSGFLFRAGVVGAGLGLASTFVAAVTIFPGSSAVALPLLFSGLFIGPVAGRNLASIWIAGKHDEQMELLEEEKKKLLAPPVPKPAEQRLA